MATCSRRRRWTRMRAMAKSAADQAVAEVGEKMRGMAKSAADQAVAGIMQNPDVIVTAKVSAVTAGVKELKDQWAVAEADFRKCKRTWRSSSRPS